MKKLAIATGIVLISVTGSWPLVQSCVEQSKEKVDKALAVNTLRELGYLTIAGTPAEIAHSAELDRPPDYTHIVNNKREIHFDKCPKLTFVLHEVAGKDVLQLVSDASGPNVMDVTPLIVDEIC